MTKQKKKAAPFNLKLLIFLAYIPVIAGLFFAGFLVRRALEKPTILYMDLSPSVTQALNSQIDIWAKGQSGKYRVEYLSSSVPWKQQLKAFKKADLLFTSAGAHAERFAPTAEAPAKQDLERLPRAIRQAAFFEGKYYALPLLLDHFELAWNKELLRKSGLNEVRSFADLLRSQGELKPGRGWPLVIAGADDRTLLGLIGALIEAEEGAEAWEALKKEATRLSPEEFAKSDLFSNVLSVLSEWRQSGFIHPEWFRIKTGEVEQFLEQGEMLGTTMFLSLSTAMWNSAL